jgi:hypothetical protein
MTVEIWYILIASIIVSAILLFNKWEGKKATSYQDKKNKKSKK